MDMLTRWPLVYIEWQDHDADASWSGEEEPEGEVEVVSSVGWLFKETADAYVVIGNQGPRQKLIGNKQRILKKLVTKTVVLSARAKRAKAHVERERPKKAAVDSGSGSAVPA